MRTQAITNIRPMVRRDANLVVSWTFRVTLAEGGKDIFEDLTVDVPDALRKELGAWRQSEVRALVEAAAAASPIIPHLGKQLDGRLLVEERMDFTLSSLQE